jgi:hypothetical protein
MAGIGLGGTFPIGTPAHRIARAFAHDARTYHDQLVAGETLVYLYDRETVVAQIKREGEAFVFRSSLGTPHSLRVAVTDADRLAAHAEGYAETYLAGRTRAAEVRLSVWF